MQKINLTITLDEANLILEGLGDLPFKKVYALVGKIQEQAGQQLRSAPPSPNGAESIPSLPTATEESQD